MAVPVPVKSPHGYEYTLHYVTEVDLQNESHVHISWQCSTLYYRAYIIRISNNGGFGDSGVEALVLVIVVMMAAAVVIRFSYWCQK